MSARIILDLHCKPEVAEEFKKGLAGILPDTRAYDGCQNVLVTVDNDDANHVVILETWDSRAHYEKYLNWRKETGALDSVGEALTQPPTWTYLDPTDI